MRTKPLSREIKTKEKKNDVDETPKTSELMVESYENVGGKSISRNGAKVTPGRKGGIAIQDTSLCHMVVMVYTSISPEG